MQNTGEKTRRRSEGTLGDPTNQQRQKQEDTDLHKEPNEPNETQVRPIRTGTQDTGGEASQGTNWNQEHEN